MLIRQLYRPHPEGSRLGVGEHASSFLGCSDRRPQLVGGPCRLSPVQSNLSNGSGISTALKRGGGPRVQLLPLASQRLEQDSLGQEGVARRIRRIAACVDQQLGAHQLPQRGPRVQLVQPGDGAHQVLGCRPADDCKCGQRSAAVRADFACPLREQLRLCSRQRTSCRCTGLRTPCGDELLHEERAPGRT